MNIKLVSLMCMQEPEDSLVQGGCTAHGAVRVVARNLLEKGRLLLLAISSIQGLLRTRLLILLGQLKGNNLEWWRPASKKMHIYMALWDSSLPSSIADQRAMFVPLEVLRPLAGYTTRAVCCGILDAVAAERPWLLYQFRISLSRV